MKWNTMHELCVWDNYLIIKCHLLDKYWIIRNQRGTRLCISKGGEGVGSRILLWVLHSYKNNILETKKSFHADWSENLKSFAKFTFYILQLLSQTCNYGVGKLNTNFGIKSTTMFEVGRLPTVLCLVELVDYLR